MFSQTPFLATQTNFILPSFTNFYFFTFARKNQIIFIKPCLLNDRLVSSLSLLFAFFHSFHFCGHKFCLKNFHFWIFSFLRSKIIHRFSTDPYFWILLFFLVYSLLHSHFLSKLLHLSR